MTNKYHIPKKYKKAEIPGFQKSRNEMYDEMDNYIDEVTGITLQELYDFKSDEYIIGIHRTASTPEEVLRKGIVMRGNDFTMHVQPFRNYPFLLREIKYCESYKLSNGCFIVKIPKKDVYAKDMNKYTEPIYYIDEEGNLRLRPEFVVAYVPVCDKKIGQIILNDYPRDIYKINTQFQYEEEIERVKNRMRF